MAFFAAGVAVGGWDGLISALTDPVAIGIIVALVLGKPIGILGTTWLLTKATRASLDKSLKWIDVFGVSLLAGIGFTVSLLVAELSFGQGSAHDDHAKVGILAASLLAAASRIRAELGPIDVAVLAAGYWKQMSADHWDTETFDRHVQVNLIGMSNAIAAVLPQMLARRSGVIAGISSVAGFRGLARPEAYGATKAGQINLLESLRVHVPRTGARVITVCPGFVRTELTAGNAFPMPFMIDADTAGRAICDGLERNRTEIVFPVRMAIVMKAARLVPVHLLSALWSRTSPPEG